MEGTMKEINIINLDQNETTLLPHCYNIGFTHFSSLNYPHYALDGVISFAGSLIEFKEKILVDRNIPSLLLQDLLFILNEEEVTYTLHSEAVDFTTGKVTSGKMLTLSMEEFDFDIYAIYSISIGISKLNFDKFLKQLPTVFKMRIMEESEEQMILLLNMGDYDLKKSIAMLKQHCE